MYQINEFSYLNDNDEVWTYDRQIVTFSPVIGIRRYLLKGHKCKLSLSSTGYYEVNYYIDKVRYNFKYHRIIAQAYIPNPNNLPEVNHKDGNKLNNDPSNLEWVTHIENVEHYTKYLRNRRRN